jgi:hypothetical protein
VVVDMVTQVQDNMNKAHIKLLKENYEKACNDYVRALLTLWDLDGFYGYWIGEEAGGVYDYGDGIFTIGMQDIVYCVENGVTEKEYEELLEYCCKCAEYNLPKMNLNSWHKGAPRHDFTKLDALKKDLNDAIDNEKNKF